MKISSSKSFRRVQGWRPGRYARVAILSLVTFVAIIGELRLAPRAWEAWTYARSYATGHIVAGYWSQGQAAAFLIECALRIFLLPVVLALIPVLLGWLIGGRDSAKKA